MRLHNSLHAVAVISMLALGSTACYAEAASEQIQIDVLLSTASLQQKDAACAALKQTGTPLSIPILAGLLTTPELSHTARYVLESMPAAAAGQELKKALGETSGALKAGIIQSLGVRKEASATKELIGLLSDPDPIVARAAAAALGCIGGAEAIKALRNALSNSQNAFHTTAHLQDALLMAADQQASAKQTGNAVEIYQFLTAPSFPGHIQVAAHRGLILSAEPKSAIKLLVAGLAGENGGQQRVAALQLARELKHTGLVTALCVVVSQTNDFSLKLGLIEALRQRGEKAAVPTLVTMIDNPNASVRAAAIGALGDLGDEQAITRLALSAASGEEAERKAARQALLDLSGEGIAQALVKELTASKAGSQQELVRALISRGETAAIQPLLAVAGGEKGTSAALQALARLVQPKDIPELVQIIVAAKDAMTREEAGNALLKACSRLQSTGANVDPAPIADAFVSGSTQVRLALLPVAGVLSDARLRDALRAGINAMEPTLRETAVKTLCEARDPELLPDLLKLSRYSSDQKVGLQALRACIRLASDQSTSAILSGDKRLDALSQSLMIATQPEEKWAALAGLGEIPDPKALALTLKHLEHEDTKAEAAQAATKISQAISKDHAQASREALQKVLAVTSDTSQKQAISALLDQMTSDTLAVSSR